MSIMMNIGRALWLVCWIVGTAFRPTHALLPKSLVHCCGPAGAFRSGVSPLKRRPGLLRVLRRSRSRGDNDDGDRGASAASDGPKFAYSDDCFGLIALSTGIAAKDGLFSLTFVALSGATALAGATVWAPHLTAASHRRQVPAAVAGATLLLVPLVRWALGSAIHYSATETMPPWTPLLEAAVCLFSLAYGFSGGDPPGPKE